jgi:hypothetical protein
MTLMSTFLSAKKCWRATKRQDTHAHAEAHAHAVKLAQPVVGPFVSATELTLARAAI